MKRPVPLVLLASLLASATALAGNISPELKQKLTGKIARAERSENRGNDHRGNDHRGNDHNGNDHRGNDSRGGHDRGRDHGNGPGSNGTRPVQPRNDHDGNRDGNHDRRDDGRNDWNRHNYNGNGNGNGHWETRGHNNGNNNGWGHYRNDWNRHPNYWDNRRHDRVDYARYRYHMGNYHRPHGYYQHMWYRGHYLPYGWYGSSYLIHDWHPYRLYSPPYGYGWVRVGNDVLLTALATGFVLDVIYDIWY